MELIIKNTNMKEGYPLFGLKDLSINKPTLSLEELKNIKDKNIFISIDKNIFNSDLPYLEKALQLIENLNLKGIFFYDLAVLSLSKRLNLKTKLIWNQDFLVTNYKTCNFYQKEGVKGAVLSPLLPEEIEEIRNNTNLELYVNIFGHQLMAVSKRHLLTSYFNYINKENNQNIKFMKEKTGTYPVIEEFYGTKFLTKDILNGIRYLNKLKEIKIDYVILDSILIENDTFSKILEYYKEAIYKDVTEERLLKMEQEINKIIPTSLEFFAKKTIYKVKKND